MAAAASELPARILWLFDEHPDEQFTTARIAALLGIQQRTAHKHLAQLVERGVAQRVYVWREVRGVPVGLHIYCRRKNEAPTRRTS